jgi:hypothetical protein
MSKLVPSTCIIKEQMAGNGQIVEFVGARYCMAVVEVQDGVWKVVQFGRVP